MVIYKVSITGWNGQNSDIGSLQLISSHLNFTTTEAAVEFCRHYDDTSPMIDDNNGNIQIGGFIINKVSLFEQGPEALEFARKAYTSIENRRFFK